MTRNREYLGDSVYAEIDCGMVKLTTNNGYPDDPRNTIYFEHEVWRNLLDWAERVDAFGRASRRRAIQDEEIRRFAEQEGS